VVEFSNPANARPAISFHGDEVFEAIKISWNISSFFMSCFLADRVSLIDIVNAFYFKIVGAIVSNAKTKENQQ
jgi:hypothetical protein